MSATNKISKNLDSQQLKCLTWMGIDLYEQRTEHSNNCYYAVLLPKVIRRPEFSEMIDKICQALKWPVSETIQYVVADQGSLNDFLSREINLKKAICFGLDFGAQSDRLVMLPSVEKIYSDQRVKKNTWGLLKPHVL